MLSKVTGIFKLCDLLTRSILLVLTDLLEPLERVAILYYMIDYTFLENVYE